MLLMRANRWQHGFYKIFDSLYSHFSIIMQSALFKIHYQQFYSLNKILAMIIIIIYGIIIIIKYFAILSTTETKVKKRKNFKRKRPHTHISIYFVYKEMTSKKKNDAHERRLHKNIEYKIFYPNSINDFKNFVFRIRL